jgi:glucuronate isomerase
MTPSLFDDDFLLETPTARELYHGYAEREPIIDYHCHLPPAEIAQNHRFASPTELWLKGDHYKWRAMRTQGVGEEYCTGPVSDWEKFRAWAATVPHTLRNPLFHWTHLELKNPFGIRRWLDPSSAREIYDAMQRSLAEERLSAQGILRHFNVVVVCTTDDPSDSLEHHQSHAESPSAKHTRVYPAWRPDRALEVERPASFNAWVDRLAAAADLEIRSLDDLLLALERRHAFFHDHGCRLSDYGIEAAYADDYTLGEVRAAFERARGGQAVVGVAARQYKSALMYELCTMDHRAGWTQQLHLGALRDNSTRMLEVLGPNTGFDSIGDFEQARPLARFLDRLDRTNQLAPTILYNLNPADNEVIATMLGNFQDGSKPGKLQYGSAWWFLDQLDGMEKQLNALSNMGLLGRFVGMLTDSRCFLSYSRHEYFRRLLCNLLGNDVRRGLLPDDSAWLGGLVRDLCFRNARAYFQFPLPDAFVEHGATPRIVSVARPD